MHRVSMWRKKVGGIESFCTSFQCTKHFHGQSSVAEIYLLGKRAELWECGGRGFGDDQGGNYFLKVSSVMSVETFPAGNWRQRAVWKC